MKLLLDFYNLSLHKGPRQVFNTIYDSIQHSFSEFKKMHVDSLYYNSYNKDIVSSLIDGKYVGVSNLLHYISNCRGYYKISANYKHRSITMYFVILKKEDLNIDITFYSTIILSYIIFISKMSSYDCSKKLTIYIYLTHFKKELNRSGKVISEKNVNSGVTYSCLSKNEICVYRKEELLKVVFHELLHSLGLDSEEFQKNKFNEDMNNLFHVSTTGNYFEAYTEFMAVNFYLYFLSFSLTNKLEECYELSNTLLQNEIYFSMYQMNKVLSYNGLSYSDLLQNKNTDLYREKTNVFAYYVLKTILLYHNSQTLEFFWNEERYLGEFIKKLANNKLFILDTFQFKKKLKSAFLEKTMRMTIFPEI